MQLIKRNRRNENLLDLPFDRFGDEIDRAIDRTWRGLGIEPLGALFTANLWPAVDVEETDQGLTLTADVPGMDPKDIDVQVDGNLLSIRGTREQKHEEKSNGMRRTERQFGQFERIVTLPAYVEADRIEAKCDKGTLTIKLPRISGKAPKKVKVAST
jgi:HSP20 family protein